MQVALSKRFLVVAAVVAVIGAAIFIATAPRDEEEGASLIGLPKESIEVQKATLAKERLNIKNEPLRVGLTAAMLSLTLSERGNTDEALPLFKEAVAAYKSGPSGLEASDVAHRLWWCLRRYCYNAKADDEAVPLYISLVEAEEQKLPVREVWSAYGLISSLKFFSDHDRRADAISIVESAIKARKKFWPTEDSSLYPYYSYLAEQHGATHSLSRLLSQSKQWLSDSEAQFGSDDIHILPELVNLISVNIAFGSIRDADMQAGRAVELVKKTNDVVYFERLAPVIVSYVKKGDLENADQFVRAMCSGKNALRNLFHSEALFKAVCSISDGYDERHEFEKAISLSRVWLDAQCPYVANAESIRINLFKYYLNSAGKASKDGDLKKMEDNITSADRMLADALNTFTFDGSGGANALTLRQWNLLIDINELPAKYKKPLEK